MTLEENKKICLGLIEEYSPTNKLLTDDEDIQARLNLVYSPNYQFLSQKKKHIQQDSPILPWGRTPEARTWFPWLSPQAPSPLLMCLISICRNKS